MPNLFQADCGFNPHSMDKFEDLTVELLNDPSGLDLHGHKNIHVSLAPEKSDVTIEEFINMQDGEEYIIVAANGATTANQLIFPQGTIYNKPITVANGETVVYKFFTDGYTIYCEREVYNNKPDAPET